MATSMLRNGYFQPLEDREDMRTVTTKSPITLDKDKYRKFEDSESARYKYVSVPVHVRVHRKY